MEKIQDYALIGNGRSAALISRTGSLDWLCWPRFESPSIFGAILDDQIGGFWKICPTEFLSTKRAYIEETNVLQTRFHTPSGQGVLTDFMVALSEEEKQNSLQPEHELIREFECEEGEVEVRIHFYPRLNYGHSNANLKELKKLGIRFKTKEHLISLRSTIDFDLTQNEAIGKTLLKKGEKIIFSLTSSTEGPAVLPPLEQASLKLRKTIEWWKNWANQCQYDGAYRKEVIRSALTLKLLSFAPSGAFIAAPTTSLPERLKGDLNWDYRFCWLRDAAFTVHALFSLGYKEDATAFVSWLLHSTRLSLPKLKVLYDVYGRNPGKETILSHLKGYENSMPVRISNAAKNQFQLDCYGEVIDAVATFVKEGGQLDGEMKKMLRLFGKYICEHWREKDNGIWEYREAKFHYTYSKLMCWVALDRLIEMNQKVWIKQSLLNKFIENRAQLRYEIEKNGWNEHLESYTDILNGEGMDVTLLLISFYGFENFNTSRMKQTYKKIMDKLHNKESGLTYRTERSLSEKEGAFVMCSFWIPEFLAREGESLDEAKEVFQKLLSKANDVGLFSEEIDPFTYDALGNFPQAFTHIALINAAQAISAREKSS